MSVLRQSPDASSPGGHDPVLEICNRMVRLHKLAFGRGPTKCRALFPDAGTVVILLGETLTVTDRTLLAMGEVARLTESRMFMQSSLEHEARAIVEDVLKRRTCAFITGVDPAQDLAVYVFTLVPTDTLDSEDAAGNGLGRPADITPSRSDSDSR